MERYEEYIREMTEATVAIAPMLELLRKLKLRGAQEVESDLAMTASVRPDAS